MLAAARVVTALRVPLPLGRGWGGVGLGVGNCVKQWSVLVVGVLFVRSLFVCPVR